VRCNSTWSGPPPSRRATSSFDRQSSGKERRLGETPGAPFLWAASEVLKLLSQKRPRLRNSASNDHAVHDQKQYRSNNRSNKTCSLTFLVPADRAAEKARDQCSGDANKHRDNNPARIFARHDELRDSPDDEANDEHPEEVHMCLVGYYLLITIGIATQIAQAPSAKVRVKAPSDIRCHNAH